MNPGLSYKGVATPVDVVEVYGRMHRREETTIQPTPALTDQLGYLIWHVRHGISTLDVVQDPAATTFRHQFPTENTIFGEVHVGGENVGTSSMHCLAKEVFLQRALACNVVLECDVPICTKRARQDGDVAEDRFPGDNVRNEGGG